ncbi:helix-turn-helix domain-containing protein [Priestia megaterium]|uniref:helix-turn-helix domain-containing protein n=1 Tax=Priestia megaterium TaxID=1404 RepID=UPI000BFB40AD|nr:helix-turn-helix transcriptional regulator [Priestia megaterium]PGR08525.1 hypothetical protein COA23_09085 [Priestia megaterium]
MNLANDLTTKETAQLRKTLGYTHKQFAKLLNISPQYQKGIEYGITPLTKAYLQRIDNCILRGDEELLRVITYLVDKRNELDALA